MSDGHHGDLPARRYIGRIICLTGPTAGWRPGDRLLAEIPVDVQVASGQWQSLPGEFASYEDAEAAIRDWWAPLLREEAAFGHHIMYVVDGAYDYEATKPPRGDPRRHDWYELVAIGSDPKGPRVISDRRQGRREKRFRYSQP
jgi:hypothetical protein